MIDDGEIPKTRKQTLIIKEGQVENRMYPEVLGTSGARIKVHIPKNTRLYDFLNVPKNKYNCREPAWKKLEDMMIIAQQSKDEWAEKIFEEFIIRMNLFFPDKTEKLRRIRQLVIWQILGGEELTEAYYESLKKMR
jgi:hypothetical protein